MRKLVLRLQEALRNLSIGVITELQKKKKTKIKYIKAQNKPQIIEFNSENVDVLSSTRGPRGGGGGHLNVT